MEKDSYSSPGAVESAIASAAKRQAMENPDIPAHEGIRREYFNRFLSRVFANGRESQWVLTGGGALLARLPFARSTTDVDLGESTPMSKMLSVLFGNSSPPTSATFFVFDTASKRNPETSFRRTIGRSSGCLSRCSSAHKAKE